ncbi:MAG: glycosyltransferase family 2 protein [Bryobacteraceae bacterium]
MPEIAVTVVIPTLAADAALQECVLSLTKQTRRDFEVIVVDNSGKSLVGKSGVARHGVRILEQERNVGFGSAINAGFRHSSAPFLATLNDDAAADPHWLEALLAAMETRPDVGMCASQVRLAEERTLDSAGMLIARDCSSKQRGHLAPPSCFERQEDVLFPSGSAALYRRAMLERIGLFDDDYFLYCEDTDLGLRARWAGWKCLYVPSAVVFHRLSHSAGRASPLKAYYVERNRLFTLVKNMPLQRLPASCLATLARYWWHAFLMMRRRGTAARFREGHGSWRLAFYVLKAHAALLLCLPRLLRKRRQVRRLARLSTEEFGRLLDAHAIPVREVAEL